MNQGRMPAPLWLAGVLHEPQEMIMNYANIVKSEEMEESRRFVEQMLDCLSVTAEKDVVPATVTCVSQGWGTLREGCSVTGEPLVLAQRRFWSGLGTHADSELRVRLPAGAKRLTGWCGINDALGPRTHAKPQVFSVEADGRELWRSGEQGVADAPARVDVQLGGRREFTLRVKGASSSYAQVVWVDMKTALTNGKTARIGGTSPLEPGFRFLYGGVSSENLFPRWSLKKQRLPEKDGVILHRITRTDPKTGLAMICEVKEYTRFPVAEWGLRFKNTSKKATPILESIRSLDLIHSLGHAPYLNHWTGDCCAADGYEPFRVSLAHEEEYRFSLPSWNGRPTHRGFPYYDLECPTTQRGLIVVVGWSGQWSAAFKGHTNQSVHITAGQELTHFKLLPGEEARAPLSVLMFYRGDRSRSRNLWRRWFLAHNMPRPCGKRMKPLLACAGSDEGVEFTGATEASQIRSIDRFNARGIKPDVWWIDAGWYPCQGNWGRTGTWEPDPERFPRGLKPVSNHAAKAGADLLIWFEPERVVAGTKIDLEHPEWLIKNGADDNRLLNLGIPECRRWLTNHVCRVIRENGIKIYRQDFNFGPLPYWRNGETPDRQGMTENLYVQGYLRYWKDLLARNPGLWIDSCASGGGRNDLESMRLGVPLHYSDYGFGNPPGEAAVKLAFHSTLFEWTPYFKEFTLQFDLHGLTLRDHEVDSFSFHCAMVPMLFASLDIRRDDYDFALAVKMIGVWRRVADLMIEGDFYPLTPHHRSSDQWVARQFDRPEEGRGFVQAIRLPAAVPESLTVYPRGLQTEAVYRLENPETGETREMTGAALQEQGFTITLPKRAGAIWMYQRMKGMT
jgi:alpha-galactosidase